MQEHANAMASYSGSFLFRTPIRSSSCHDSIRLNILIIFLPDCHSIMINIMIIFLLGHRNIMITIIIFLPHNICVRTIVKDKRYLPMHEHTIMHEVPTFFHFHYHLIQYR